MPSYRPWGSTDNGEIEFESLTTETLEGGLRVIRESFFSDESVCKAVDLLSEPGAAEELEALCLDAAKDGVSVVAVEVATGEVVAVGFNKIQVLPSPGEKAAFEIFGENCKYKSSKALVDFMIDVDSRVNLFKHYNVDCILEVMFLATLPAYSQRRLGELVVSASLEIGKQLKDGKMVKTPVTVLGDDKIPNEEAVPGLTSMILTSNYSQKICAKLGFDRLLRVGHDQYEFQGKLFSERIGPHHKDSTLDAKRL